MAAAVLAKVSGKVAKSRTAANNAEKEAIVQDAYKAATQLAIVAQRTLEMAADLGLTAAQMAHIENIVAAAQTFAANLAHAAAKMATDDDHLQGLVGGARAGWRRDRGARGVERAGAGVTRSSVLGPRARRRRGTCCRCSVPARSAPT